MDLDIKKEKLNLQSALKMLNECGTNINSMYENDVLDLINKALTPPRTRQWTRQRFSETNPRTY